MKNISINFDRDTFGITRKSLKVLRDILMKWHNIPIIILRVDTSDLTYGYLILSEGGDAAFTGDGFRSDNGGEGGAGSRSAEHLLEILGLHIYDGYYLDLNEVYQESLMAHNNSYEYWDEDIRSRFLELLEDIVQELDENSYIKIIDCQPKYLRGAYLGEVDLSNNPK